nr:hypothetical protein [uncultured Pedobacter sp.]
MQINNRILLALFCALVLSLSACKKDTTATLTIHVLDPNHNAAPSIGFDILENTDRVSYRNHIGISTADGDVNLTLTKGKSYLIYLLASEAYSDWYMGNSAATFVATGTFKSLEEINHSPIQKPTPKVGDTKYADFNGDGAINIDDLVLKVDLKEDTKITVNLIGGRNAFYGH